MIDESRASQVGCVSRLHLGVLTHSGDDCRRVRSVAQMEGWPSTRVEDVRQIKQVADNIDVLVICARHVSADLLAVVTEAALDPRIPVLVIGRDRDPQHLSDVLRSGAADYLVAPFAAEELVARIQALVMRSHHVSERRAESELVFDFFTRTVVAGPVQISLSPREWDALIVLLEMEAELVSVETLSESLTGSPDNETIVISTISRLRRKLRSNQFYAISLETVYGHGYLARFRRSTDTFVRARKIV